MMLVRLLICKWMDRQSNYLNLEDVLSGKFDKCLTWLCLLTKEDDMQVTRGSYRICMNEDVEYLLDEIRSESYLLKVQNRLQMD